MSVVPDPTSAAPAQSRAASAVGDVQRLRVRFGEVEAVRGISFSVDPGAATARLGRNGAGKSTTMRVLAGVIPPTEGEVWVHGRDLRHETIAVKRLTGY